MKPELKKLRESVRDRLKGWHARGYRTKTFYIGPDRPQAAPAAGPDAEASMHQGGAKKETKKDEH